MIGSRSIATHARRTAGSASSSIATEPVARRRRLLCLLAGALAGFASVLTAADKSLTASPDLLASGLAVLMGVALAFAVWPAAAEWSHARRIRAGVAAAGWLLLSGPLLVLTIAVGGCACSAAGPDFQPIAPLGVDTRQWVIVALASGAVLLAVAAALHSRKAGVIT